MEKDTLDYVRRCLICQKTKAERVKIPGKLQPLDIPQMKWECISMDFVTGLPKTTGNYDSIFVIVDKLTKVAHLIPVKQTAIAADIAQVFFKEIVRLHGIRATIISDRDAKFTPKFWQAMFQSLGTQLNLSTAYHPETNGQTERVNQIDENFIWTEKRDFAFNELKNLLDKSPVLKLLDFEKTFEVIVDACEKGVGGILRQEGYPIAYESRQLRIHERNYLTHDLELLAVVHALKKWRHYLLSQIFELVTDHKSLKWIFTQPELNMRQRR
ncbi:hypothetical protein L7F22_020240 [Adiantum nelumboides]|nr:hypothetical protein [Adiantum nelumboides]